MTGVEGVVVVVSAGGSSGGGGVPASNYSGRGDAIWTLRALGFVMPQHDLPATYIPSFPAFLVITD